MWIVNRSGMGVARLRGQCCEGSVAIVYSITIGRVGTLSLLST